MNTHAHRAGRPGQTKAAVAIALLAVAVGIWVAFGLLRTPNVAPEEGRAIAEAFLEQVRGGQVDSAWGTTTAEFKSLQGLEEFRAFVKEHPQLATPVEFAHVQNVTRNQLPLAQCTFRASDKATTIKVLLAREGGQWKVEHIGVE